MPTRAWTPSPTRSNGGCKTSPNSNRSPGAIVEMMAFALQGSLLVQHSTPAVADAFCATRLDGDWGRAFGTMPKGVDMQAIIDRARIAAV